MRGKKLLNVQIKKSKNKNHIKYNSLLAKDDRFSPVEIAVLYIGESLNNDYFSKEVVEDAIKSLPFVPILGKIKNKNGKNDFSGHEERLEFKDGETFIEYDTIPYGVIPEQNNARFEYREDGYGEIREYLVVDGILWNRMTEALEIFEEDKVKSQSMEIIGEWYFDEERKVEVIEKFTFIGLTILGDDTPPAMTGANISIGNKEKKNDEYTLNVYSVLQEIKEILKGEDAMKGKTYSEENVTENINVSNDNILNDVEEIENVNPEQTVQNTTENKKVEDTCGNVAEPTDKEKELMKLLEETKNELNMEKEKFSKLEQEYNNYRNEKDEKEKQDIFNKFNPHLQNNEDFQKLCETKAKMNAKDFENKCNKIFTEFLLENMKQATEKKNEQPLFFSVNTSENQINDRNELDDFIQRYLNK